MGSHLATALDEGYVAIGTSSYELQDADNTYPLPDQPEGFESPWLAQLLHEVAEGTPALLVDLTAMTSDQALLPSERVVLLRTRNHYADSDVLFETSASTWFDALIWLERATCGQDWLQ